MVSTPKPPDPEKTAAAQTGMNRDTALTQQQINMVNQVGPDGTLSYNQTGTSKFKDSKGDWVETPTYTATTSLSKAQQAIKTQTDAASLNLGKTANQQSSFLKDYLGKPFEYNNQDAENWANELGAKRLDPRFAKENDALRTQLIGQGIRSGSAAYDAEMERLGQNKNDAYNQLALTGRQQGFSEALTTRNQPINEIGALMSGSQVSQPQFQQTPQTSVGGVDYAGLVNSNYQAKVASSNAAMGGLFGLAAAPFSMFKFSDARLKSNIKQVGTLFNGLPVYLYEMDGKPPEIGLLAHEVESFRPEAVAVHESGFKMVAYGKAVI